MSAYQLLSAAGSSAIGSTTTWCGGVGMFNAVGTFGGGTVKLQYIGADGTTWIDAGSSTAVVAASGALFELPPGQIRAVIVGSSGAIHARVARTGG
jgi:hypothetical protein